MTSKVRHLMAISWQLFREAEGSQTDHSATTSSKSTVSYQTTAYKCQDGNLSQHANEVVIVETDCGVERVLLTNCNRHYSKWGGMAY
jgi:hypothetical protein